MLSFGNCILHAKKNHVIFSIYSLNMNGNCWCICSREVKSVKLLQIIFLTLTLQMEQYYKSVIITCQSLSCHFFYNTATYLKADANANSFPNNCCTMHKYSGRAKKNFSAMPCPFSITHLSPSINTFFASDQLETLHKVMPFKNCKNINMVNKAAYPIFCRDRT